MEADCVNSIVAVLPLPVKKEEGSGDATGAAPHRETPVAW